MKLHPDGTVEGTLQEILEYARLQSPAKLTITDVLPKRSEGVTPNPSHPAITCDSTKEGIYVSKQPSQAKF